MDERERLPLKDEIEITDAMIEAGVDAIWSLPGSGAIAGFFSASDLACRVYWAMRDADHTAIVPCPD